MNTITIANKKIGLDHRPFIIAEMSGNHNQSLERAIQIVEAAHNAGADALKIQTYTADTMTIDLRKGEFLLQDKKGEWNGKSLYQIYHEAHTPWEWHAPIIKRCEELGMICFSTPFDETAVDFLESLKTPLYKVASFECNDLKLIKKIATTGKPIIISTGMASLSEIDDAVQMARNNGANDLVLLKCTSAYPSDPKNANIRTIPHMRETFNVLTGLSDHTLGIGVAVAATALGATVIEKHFTLKRSDGGVDAAFSLEPDEFKLMVSEVKKAWDCLGQVTYTPTAEDKKSSIYRRSLYAVQDIQKGDTINSSNVRAIRPGLGLPTKYYDQIMGKVANKPIARGTPLNWDMF